jgi:hypothetical protein
VSEGSEHYLVVCKCGAQVVTCLCPGPHLIREVLACGRCTATGGMPDVPPLAPALREFYQQLLLEERIVSPLFCDDGNEEGRGDGIGLACG